MTEPLDCFLVWYERRGWKEDVHVQIGSKSNGREEREGGESCELHGCCFSYVYLLGNTAAKPMLLFLLGI